jgi:hypothetical protein
MPPHPSSSPLFRRSLTQQQQRVLEDEANARKIKLSKKGFADAPATFRKVGQTAAGQMREFREGSPNPERRILGGVVTTDPIERDISVNLVALRGLGAMMKRRARSGGICLHLHW